MAEKSRRGFASMDKNKQKEIASKGGKAAHRKGTAHKFTSEEAKIAGRKGGEAVSKNREHMAEIGRRGGEARGDNLSARSDYSENEQGEKVENVGGVSMNAIEMLENDHRKVEELFEEFETHHQKNIAERACMELEIHSTLEEEIFYPAARQVAADLVAESIEEHKVVKNLIQELRSGLDDEQYEAKFKELMENVEHHVEEEESEMFPEVEIRLANQLDSLGMQMQKRKDELTRGTATRAASA